MASRLVDSRTAVRATAVPPRWIGKDRATTTAGEIGNALGNPRPEEAARLAVLVVSAHPAVRAGLRTMLDGAAGIEVVAEARPGNSLGSGEPFDVVVVDLGDEPRITLEWIEREVGQSPAVLFAREAEDYGVLTLPGLAARALLSHDSTAEEIQAAVLAVAAGLVVVEPAVAMRVFATRPDAPGDRDEPVTLTPRELDVLPLIASGLPNKAIALRLGISEHTAKFHVASVLGKLGAGSRAEAVMIAARRGLLHL
jgi:DNA-binding NarL/FixJ family response regulator